MILYGKELVDFLASNTNETNKEIKRDIENGSVAYSNDDFGMEEFITDNSHWGDSIRELIDTWEKLQIIGDFRVDWVI